MQVIDFDGVAYKFPPLGHTSDKYVNKHKSELHTKCRTLLQTIFPARVFLEEVPIPGLKLYVDFFLIFSSTVIEVQGRQHLEYTPHFHANKLEFYRARQRDELKRRWCELNNIGMVELLYNEDISVWKSKILGS